MTAGTKVFLALFALILGVLVVYYGMSTPRQADFSPPDPLSSSSARAPQTAPARTSSNTTPRTSTHTISPNTGLAAPSHPTNSTPLTPRGLLGEAIDRAKTQSVPTAVTPVPSRDEPAPLPLFAPALIDDAPTINEPARAIDPAEIVDTHNEPAAPPTRPLANTPTTVGPVRTIAPAPPAQKMTEYLVKSGDTMSSIAQHWFGDPNKWSLIAKANPLVDPARLSIDQKLMLPPKDAAAETPKPQVTPAGQSVYTVQSGDTLSKIARIHLGDPARWEQIYEANKAAIGPDPGALKVGMQLHLPRR